MTIGIRCLLADTAVAALPLASELDRLNRERRDVEATMQEEAEAELAARSCGPDSEDAYTLCLFRPEWHQGVVGIVASRLKDRYHRPAIVFARGDAGEIKGSGRSIAGFHLRDALDLVAKRLPGVIARFGGHAYAAGLSLAEPDLPRFAAAFEGVARDALTPADLARIQSRTERCRRPRSRWSSPRRSPPKSGARVSPRRRSTTVSPSPNSGSSGDAHSRLTLERRGEGFLHRFDAILFDHAEPLPRAIRAALPPRRERMERNRRRCSSLSCIGSLTPPADRLSLWPAVARASLARAHCGRSNMVRKARTAQAATLPMP